MISRTTARQISLLFALSFRQFGSYSLRGRNVGYYESIPVAIYDFLYEHDFPAYLCNAARKAAPGSRTTRNIEDFIMKLHTGESLVAATSNWSWPDRERLGQEHLKNLAEDLIEHWRSREREYGEKEEIDPVIVKLKAGLELDGFVFRGKVLLAPEADVLDAAEQGGVLQVLYSELALGDRDTAFHHLRLSEEHYIAQRWDDCIANSRKFFEEVMEQSAIAYSARKERQPLDSNTAGRPVRIRDYLERINLLERKEKEAIAAIYGLLSHTGGHPYMAQSDQARLLRHLALTLSHFIMLRLRGALSP
jgi:hypothetical protein